MDIYLKNLWNIEIIQPNQSLDINYLQKILFLTDAKTTLGEIDVANVSNYQNYTDDLDAVQFFQGGMTEVYIGQVSTVDYDTFFQSANEIIANNYGKFHYIVLSKDLDEEILFAYLQDTTLTYDKKDFTWCVVGALVNGIVGATALTFAKTEGSLFVDKSGAKTTAAPQAYYAWAKAAIAIDSEQTLQLPGSTGLISIVDINYLNSNLISFSIFSESYGNRLALLVQASSAFHARALIAKINNELSYSFFQYVSINKPSTTKSEAKAIEAYLQSTVLEGYLLDSSYGIVTAEIVIDIDPTTNKFAGTTNIKLNEPTALWRISGTINLQN
jgi:hypothetical protein